MQMINDDNFERDGTEGGQSTVTVVTLLGLAAGVFSYLGAYAMAGVLVSADLMSPWPVGEDPRPRNTVLGFFALMAIFMLIATGFRMLSSRQLHRIDAMAEEG